jgi:MoaA/NifB/PqqE/SkfB family radical SAM enzyme
MDRWRACRPTRTPEYFLLQQAGQSATARLGVPTVEFDPVTWAGDLIWHAAAALAADYEAAGRPADVPPQLQVQVPGGRHDGEQAPVLRPMFSMICPSIRPEFLRETVESVRSQTWDRWELRIGIDGPKPVQLRKLVAVLDEFKADPRIRIRRFEHLGTGPVRRRLALDAEGDYIVGIDDDDRLAPHALERFAQAIEANPSVALLRGGTRVFGLYDAYLPPRPRYLIGGISNDLFEVNQPWAVSRRVLESFGGFEWDAALKNAGEDSDLFLKIDRAQLPVVTIDEPLYERRLSTLNQTLDCTADECLAHVHTLYRKHDPAGWALTDVQFADHGAVVGMRTVHRMDGESKTVVCATRFMNFQQVGSRDGVVLDLEVTSLCNAVCTFCPREHLERSSRFISLETVQRVADSLPTERGTPMVVLCGIGESTLHPELEAVIRMLASAGARVGLTTNGWNLSLELVDRLVAAGLAELNVSLNAATAETHAALMQLKNFAAITEACRAVAAERLTRWPGLEFHVSFVVTDRNAAEARAFADEWRAAGVSQVWLHRLTNRRGLLSADCKPADMEHLADAFRGDPRLVIDMFPGREGPANLCRVAQGVDFISVDGEMLLCAQDYGARHTFGNVAHASLARLHEAKLLGHLRGQTAATCAGCTFCPPSFKDAGSGTYSIVQAGAV